MRRCAWILAMLACASAAFGQALCPRAQYGQSLGISGQGWSNVVAQQFICETDSGTNTLTTSAGMLDATKLSGAIAATTGGSTFALTNASNAGSCLLTFQADKGDDAGDKCGILVADGAGIAFQSDVSVKGTLATKASVGTDGIINTAVGFDAIGAVDLDYGSADVTDHTFVSDGGTVILDGSVTLTTGDHLVLGTTQWDNGSDKIDGEQIADDTIDDDSIDFSDVTGADFTLTDCGAIGATSCTVDSKAAIVGKDTTEYVLDFGTATIGAGGTVTVTWGADFAVAPFPVVSYSEAPGADTECYFSSVSSNSALLTGAASKGVYWQAVGAR